MKAKVLKAIKDYSMLSDGESVLVALSGGADSVALLLVLIELGYNVSACHVNHQLRGEESERDENFCIEICNREKILLYVEKVDVISYCNSNKYGTEEGARQLRYMALDSHSKGMKIATAHTASDNLETVLINLSRGTALKGLCGIPPVRGNIIRPLIYCTREDVEVYLKDKGQAYVTDSTNLTDVYTRNRIRHEVVPVLKSVNPSLENSFIKSIASLIEDNQYLELQTELLLKTSLLSDNEYDAKILSSAHDCIKHRAIAQILRNNDLECNNDKVNSIANILKTEGKINLFRDVYAISKEGKLKICTVTKLKKISFNREIEIGQSIRFFNKEVTFKLENINMFSDEPNVNKKFAIAKLDYDKIQGKAIVRNRLEGDRIRFSGRDHTTSVKKLFNSKVPLHKRGEIVFISDEEGVIFIEGFGVAERVKVDDKSARVVLINIIERNVEIE